MTITIENKQFEIQENAKGHKILGKIGFWFHPEQRYSFHVTYQGQNYTLRAEKQSKEIVTLTSKSFVLTFRYDPDEQTIVPLYLLDMTTPF
jgi:hypothetical protein